MSDTVISVENLGKKYIISHLADNREKLFSTLLVNKAKTFFSRGRKVLSSPFTPSTSLRTSNHHSLFTDAPLSDSLEEFWALKDVSFDIKQGDRVGIIGRNGAGKSTLLKILSRITEPTRGRITIDGRVASLLEVGTGFHSELSGRENIYLNGAILGMSREEIRRKFDEIVAFAEVDKFLDTPVKRYSSGMYVRLAFAVAAHLEPEILIVDEVLAVGDAQFQKKCLGRMEEVSKEGRTILFVSHNMTALQSLCSRAVWLNEGRIMDSGLTGDVVSNYLQNGSMLRLTQVWNDPQAAPGNKIVRLHSTRITYDGEADNENIIVTTPIRMEFEFWNYEPDTMLNFSVVLYDQHDICIFNTGSEAKRYSNGIVKGICHIPGNLLNDAVYRVRLLIVKDASTALLDLENVASFEVHDTERDGNWYGKWIGTVRPNLRWETSCLEL